MQNQNNQSDLITSLLKEILPPASVITLTERFSTPVETDSSAPCGGSCSSGVCRTIA